jgi:hypothetical protein
LTPEEVMRHDWIFDVLSDLCSYATQNDLPGLAAKVSETLAEARREIAIRVGQDEPSGAPPSGRRAN